MLNSHPTITEILTRMDAEGKISWEKLSKREMMAIKNMMICHTEVCGYTSETCSACGYTEIHYGSCNSSCCSQCGLLRQKRWALEQMNKVVNAPYFHIIMTVPDNLLVNLFRYDPDFMYSTLMRASAETLKELSANPKYMGVKTPGFYTTLHTWGSTMIFHPHTHSLFCGAGLDKNGELVTVKPKFLFPAKVAAKLFRGKFLSMVNKKYGGDSPFRSEIFHAGGKEWNVEIKSCEGGPNHAILYTSRYIYRTAISNSRLVSYENGRVRFTYKDYRDNCKIKECDLEDTEFLRRLVSHIPPAGFIRTRHYGFMSNNSSEKLRKIQILSKYKHVADLNARAKEEECNSEETELRDCVLYKKCSLCGEMSVTVKVLERARTAEDKERGRRLLVEKARLTSPALS